MVRFFKKIAPMVPGAALVLNLFSVVYEKITQGL